jgi:hypothetical protein
VAHSLIPLDTDATSYAALTDSWRAMGIAQRAALTQRLCLDVEQLARSGIAAAHPAFSEIEICHELARRRYGSALADEAYAGLLVGG